jgi:O-antigen/teichoic acid export membrane protein
VSDRESDLADRRVTSAAALGRRRGSVTKLASSTYLATLLGIVSGPIIARVLGVEGRGEYAAVMIYSSTAVMILSFGMSLSVNHATLTLRQDPRVVYGNILRFTCLLVLPSLLLAAAVLPLVWDLSDTARVGAVVFIALAPLGVLQLCLNSFLISESALGSLTVVSMLPLVLNFVGVVVLATTGRLTVQSYLVLTLAGMLATLGLALWSVRLRPRSGGRLGPQFRFGLRAYPGSLAGIANSQLDQLLVAPLLGARDLGHYAVAVTMANLPLGIAQALSARSVRDMTKPEGGLDFVRTAATLRQTIVLSLMVTASLAAVIPALVPLLYGRAFTEVVGLSLVLLIGTVALAISTIAGPALSLAGRPGATSVAQLVALVVTAAGLAISLPLLGVIGAAITTAVAYWIRAGMNLWSLRRAGVIDMCPRVRDFRDVTLMLIGRARGGLSKVTGASRRR